MDRALLLCVAALGACTPPEPRDADAPPLAWFLPPDVACSDACAHDLGEVALASGAVLAFDIESGPARDHVRVTLEDDGGGAFTLPQALDGPLKAGESAPLLLAFSPALPGEAHARVVAEDTGPAGDGGALDGAAPVGAAAVGAALVLDVRALARGEGITVDPVRCAFGPLPVGETSAPCAIALINGSARDIAIEHLAVRPAAFVLVNAPALPATIAPLAALTVAIAAVPEQPGPIFGALDYGHGGGLFIGAVALSADGR